MNLRRAEQYVRRKVFESGNRPIQHLFEPAFFRRRIDNRTAYQLGQFGALVGLSQSEVEGATKHYSGAVSRLCSRMLFLLVIAFLIFVLAGLAGVNWASFLEEPISTYTPGTRYASIRPSDFGE